MYVILVYYSSNYMYSHFVIPPFTQYHNTHSHTHTHTHPHPLPGHTDCINSLVGSGADVNVKDKKHYTPLHAAAAGGQCHAVKMLLELGANVSHSTVHVLYRHGL